MALRLPGLQLQFCRPGKAQPPPGIKRLRARWRCACRVCCFGFVGRVRRSRHPATTCQQREAAFAAFFSH
ncbi:hypothetical protein DMQ72_24400 [Klebsiella quasipneumoniae]|nr:hypothetical protein DMQ72_24400 [Klebsiella quasipneumoniae]